jgi:hypothetical protein
LTRPPFLFISHKHSDKPIADAFREFVEDTLAKVTIFQSSSAEAEGVAFGRVLSEGLKEALWKAGVVLLIYTTEDQDWSWCMWECGVATNPSSPETRTIVLQCSTAEPRVFADQRRCDARLKEDIHGLVRDLLTDPKFFPDSGGPLIEGLNRDSRPVRDKADNLYARLEKVLPKTEYVERLTFPNVRLELPEDDYTALIKDALDPVQLATRLSPKAQIESMEGAQQIFGIAGGLKSVHTLESVARQWAGYRPGSDASWVEDICLQIKGAAQSNIPQLNWNCIREVTGLRQYVPVLSRVRPLPATRRVQFDVQLLPYDEFAATPVTSRMIPRAEMQVFSLGERSESDVRLFELVGSFGEKGINRIPFLDAHDRIRYMAHSSMIDRFLVSHVAAGGDMKGATLADLLTKAPDLKRMFERTFAIVDKDARLSEAHTRMTSLPDCRDVFVTANGSPESPVQGWVTNVILTQGRQSS